MHVRANAKGLTLREEYEGPLPETITTDPARLRQILVNLVGNAIKFTEAGGVRIVTRLLRHGGHEPKLRFEVLDTGIGIPETAIGKLFQPFTQVDASASRKYEGTGLGLTISRQLAWALGGDVTAQSEFGQGSTFTVTVPTGSLEGVRLVEYQTDARPTLGLPQESTATSWKKRACRVLLAEDIPDNQRLIGAMLREVGVDVTVANNGQEAVEKALATRPGWGRRAGDPREAFDVILMDIQMPVLDGYGATRRLRQEGYTGPIIALTAHAMRGDRQKCLDAGCDDYVSKPVDRKTLLETVARWGPAEEKQAEIAGSSPATCAQDFVAPCAHV
jgi:CheY-like chemotaxis protein